MTQTPVTEEPSTVPANRGAADPIATLAAVTRLLDSLSETDWGGLPGPVLHEAVDRIEQASRRVASLRSGVVAAVEADGTWALNGARTYPTWLRDRTGAAPGGAHRQVRTARALRDHLPRTQAALEAGRIGEDHVGVLVREATKSATLRDALADPEHGEQFLLEFAETMDAGQFNKAVRAWAIRVDPEGSDRAWRQSNGSAEVTLAQTMGGWHLSGWLDDHGGRIVDTAFQAFLGPRAAGDTRTLPERLAAALVTMASGALDRGEQGEHARVRPHLAVTVPWDSLRRLCEATATAIPRPHARPGTLPGLDGAAPGLGTAPGYGVAPDRDAAAGSQTGAQSHRPGGDGATGPGAREGGPTVRGAREGGPAGRDDRDGAWVRSFRPGDDHVISSRYDHDAMVGAEPATFEDGTPLPPALLARIACSSQLARIVFGPDSTILDSGREVRIFTAGQTRAIIARDRHCQYPRCQEPPSRGEIHHSLWWGRHQGPTSTDHGILLCWHHHTLVHAREIDIARRDGEWIFTDRHGQVIGAPEPKAVLGG